MKPKALSKKLTFNKKTVAHLDNGKMKVINGGLRTLWPSPGCPSKIHTECFCDTSGGCS